jgi:hypothetical protein
MNHRSPTTIVGNNGPITNLSVSQYSFFVQINSSKYSATVNQRIANQINFTYYNISINVQKDQSALKYYLSEGFRQGKCVFSIKYNRTASKQRSYVLIKIKLKLAIKKIFLAFYWIQVG